MAHTHYKGTGKIHSFRGLLASGEQDKIGIQGSVGATAWHITKFEVFSQAPGAGNQNSVVQIFREEQSSIVGTVDFNDNELLGVGQWKESSGVAYPVSTPVIFDNALFTRNIWVTHLDVEGANDSCNYYIELEEVKVSAAGMAQLSLAASRRVQTDV